MKRWLLGRLCALGIHHRMVEISDIGGDWLFVFRCQWCRTYWRRIPGNEWEHFDPRLPS